MEKGLDISPSALPGWGKRTSVLNFSCANMPSPSLCDSSQPTMGSVMVATSIVAQLEAGWSLVTRWGSRQASEGHSALCSPRSLQGLSGVKGHFLTGFVLSTQLCSFLVLRLSFEGTQQARPIPWFPLLHPEMLSGGGACRAGGPPCLPLCAPHFQVSSGRAGWFALGGGGGGSQLV